MFFKNMRISISKKLTLIYSSILFCILITFTLLTFFLIRNSIIKDSETILSYNADIICNYISNTKIVDKEVLDNIKLSKGILYSIYDRDNSKVVFSNIDNTKSKKNHGGNRRKNNKDSFELNDGVIYVDREVAVNGTVYYVQVTKEFEDLGSKPDAIIEILITISILGTLVCFVSGSFLSKKLLRPIQDIAKTTKDITSKSLDKRIVINGADDEIKELADTFNTMIERLETDFEKQKRFVSDASHELRTPLSVIHGHVNMLNRWGKDDPEQLKKSLKTLMFETENMSKLIENLLCLARGDNSSFFVKKEDFSLNLLLKEIIDETLLTYSELKVFYTCDSEIKMFADYNLLKQLLRILIDNSIKFNKDNEPIVINAEKKPEGVLIKVQDNGIGIPSESLPHVFNRFYRVDESRTKTTGGSGLGLSIAKQIVESHEGSISIESKLGEGTSVNVFVPFINS